MTSIQILMRPALDKSWGEISDEFGMSIPLEAALAIASRYLTDADLQRAMDRARLYNYAEAYLSATSTKRRTLNNLPDGLMQRVDRVVDALKAHLPPQIESLFRDAKAQTGANRTFAIYLLLALYAEQLHATA